MSRTSLEPRISHDYRLDILCCLVDESLSLSGLSAQLRKPTATVAYHLNVLEDCDVVERKENAGGGDALYAATLEGHPPWVAEAVADYKDPGSDQADSFTAARVMVEMKCNGCERLLRYKDKVVAVCEEEGERRAKILTEDSPESGEAASFQAIEKYHLDCYAKARERDPLLPPIRG